MAAGRPILAAVPDGDAKDFLSRCGTAFICRPDDASAMVRILDQVYTAWKSGGPALASDREFVDNFERRRSTRRLAQAFGSLLAGRRPAASVDAACSTC
jgi:hypothetical protein